MTYELQRFRLDGRVAIVGGGSGGIGVRTCAALAGVGADVAIVARSATRLDEARTAVEKSGRNALVIAADMVSREQAELAIEQTIDTFGHVDVVVNAIGGGAGTALFRAEQYPDSEWQRILDLNLTTAVHLSQSAARAMISALTRQHATEWARHGIRVNAISPTFVRTAQTASLLDDQDFYERLVSRIPLRRIADPDDLVGAILFFCSEAAGFVTGQVLTLDGGLTATQ